eukprot:TRINITY_DN50672_c0_g1_i1.p1 TRINITY_DN50672_c0_g1~~TRINITY_DN50672_c0_g1_i1.p1  ORF type:complete len:170 (+),score=44.68 TRINITY_DN50672_c0_g1_i1:47-556(+)
MGAKACGGCVESVEIGQVYDEPGRDEKSGQVVSKDQAVASEMQDAISSFPEKDTRGDAQAIGEEKAPHADSDYFITVDKRDTPKLGIDVDAWEGNKSLPILSINGGLIALWNSTHPECSVREGDHIFEVNGINGVTGSIHDMMDCCRREQILKMKLRKSEHLTLEERGM